MSDIASPLVSVLTTVYNRESYLADCIESVLNSTYTNWELIIVDDQSTDKSLSIAKSYAMKDQRIKVFLNKENLGDYPNRNEAAIHAKGKYIKYLDSDDLIYPHGLEIMVRTMELFPEAVIGISQEVAEDKLPFPFQLSPYDLFYREFLQRGVLGFAPTDAIIRRKEFIEQGMFTGARYIGDIEMWLRLSLNYPAVKMVPGLVYWRVHEDQEYAIGMKSYGYLEMNYKNSIYFLNHPDCPLTENEVQLAMNKLNHRFSRDITRVLVKKRDFKAISNVMNRSGFSWLQLISNLKQKKSL